MTSAVPFHWKINLFDISYSLPHFVSVLTAVFTCYLVLKCLHSGMYWS